MKSLFPDEQKKIAVCKRIFEYIWLCRTQKPLKTVWSSGYVRWLLILQARIHPNLKKYDWQLANAYFEPTPSDDVWKTIITEQLNKKGGKGILRQRWYYYDEIWTNEEIAHLIISHLQQQGIEHIHRLQSPQIAQQMTKAGEQLIEILKPILINTELIRVHFKPLIKTYLEMEEDLRTAYGMN